MKQETVNKMRAARGEVPAELVLKNALVLHVFTGEWLIRDVAVCGDTIVGVGNYHGEKEVELEGKALVPGFIDAHVHIESSMLTPSKYITEILPWGTTTIIADPHELANVAGEAGGALRAGAEQRTPLQSARDAALVCAMPCIAFEHSGAFHTRAGKAYGSSGGSGAGRNDECARCGFL